MVSDKIIKKLVSEELSKPEVINLVKKDKDIEKRIKEIATEVIVNLFKILWQHRNFYETNITK